MTGHKIAWSDELVQVVLECHPHYRAFAHAKNTLDKMLAAGEIMATQHDYAIVAAAKMRAIRRDAEAVNAVQQPLIDTPVQYD